MELAPTSVPLSSATAADFACMLALHGASSPLLPRRAVAVESHLRISVTFGMQAVAQARSRSVHRGGKRWHFTPGKTREFCAVCKTLLASAWGARGFLEYARLEADVYVERPQRLAAGELGIPCNVKPDADNYLKSMCEVCEGIVVENDSRFCGVALAKFYVPKNHRPFIDLRVYELKFSAKN